MNLKGNYGENENKRIRKILLTRIEPRTCRYPVGGDIIVSDFISICN